MTDREAGLSIEGSINSNLNARAHASLHPRRINCRSIRAPPAPLRAQRVPARAGSLCAQHVPLLGVKVPYQPDGGEGLAKEKGGIVRWKAMQRKTAA